MSCEPEWASSAGRGVWFDLNLASVKIFLDFGPWTFDRVRLEMYIIRKIPSCDYLEAHCLSNLISSLDIYDSAICLTVRLMNITSITNISLEIKDFEEQLSEILTELGLLLQKDIPKATGKAKVEVSNSPLTCFSLFNRNVSLPRID